MQTATSNRHPDQMIPVFLAEAEKTLLTKKKSVLPSEQKCSSSRPETLPPFVIFFSLARSTKDKSTVITSLTALERSGTHLTF